MAPPLYFDSDSHSSLPELYYQYDASDEAPTLHQSFYEPYIPQQHQQQQQQKDGAVQDFATRHDSPIESRTSIPHILEIRSEQDNQRASASYWPQANIQHGLQLPPPAVITPTPSAPGTDDEDSHRFVMVSNPTKATDKSEMRGIRQHVMKDYLRKESRKETGVPRDARVEHPSVTGSKRRKMDFGLVSLPGREASSLSLLMPQRSRASQNPMHPGQIFGSSELTPETSASSAASSLVGGDSEGELGTIGSTAAPALVSNARPPNALRRRRTAQFLNPHTSPPRSQNSVIQAPSEQPLLLPWRIELSRHVFILTDPSQVPLPRNNLGNRLNPFNTWPAFADARVNVRDLRYQACMHFGSRGLSTHWIPALLRARHAFLSTMCVSAAYGNVMRREGRDRDSYELLAMRSELHKMINTTIAVEGDRSSDETIMAVLQLLMSETMSADAHVVQVHETGLNRMVLTRGGLENTGEDRLGGHLPAILTVTMYVVAALYEKLLHETYTRFAHRRHVQPPKKGESGKPFPENPAFCGDSYVTVRRALEQENGKLLRLLDHLRMMTDVFGSNQQLQTRQQDLAQLKKRIDDFAAEDEDRFAGEEARRYEVVRLTAQLYAHAIVERVPFSQAAMASGIEPRHIAAALMRTNILDCWNHMSGVLFWIALVAGAAANFDSGPSDLGIDPKSSPKRPPFSPPGECEHDEARRYLATLAIRCSIVLGFEHGSVVLETLKRVVALQQALGSRLQVSQELGNESSGNALRETVDRGQFAMQPGQQQQQQQPRMHRESVPHGQLAVQSTPAQHRRPQVPRAAALRAQASNGQLAVPRQQQQQQQQQRFFGPPRPVYQQQQQNGFGDYARDFLS